MSEKYLELRHKHAVGEYQRMADCSCQVVRKYGASLEIGCSQLRLHEFPLCAVKYEIVTQYLRCQVQLSSYQKRLNKSSEIFNHQFLVEVSFAWL